MANEMSTAVARGGAGAGRPGSMTRRRMMVAGGAAGGTLLALAACGAPGAGGSGQGGLGSSAAPVTVTMWHIWDTTRVAPFHRSLEMLTERKPNIRVDPQVMAVAPDREKEQKITAVIAAGDPPDLLMINQGIFANLAGGSAVIALDDFLKADKLNPNDWYEGAYKSSVWNGKLYGLPAVNSGPRLLYFNKAFFREAGLDPNRPPQTWEQLQQMSRQLTQRQGDVYERTGWNPAVGAFQWLIFTNSGRLFSPDGKKVAFGGAEGQQTIEYLTDFVWSVYDGPAKLAASGGLSGNFTQGTSRSAFTVNGPFLIPQIAEAAPQFDYGVAPIPHSPRGKFADPMWVNWMYSIPVATRARAAAWEVAKWVGHGEGHRWFMLDQRRPGVIKKYNEDPEYPRINPHWRLINEILDKYTVEDKAVPGRGLAIAAMDRHLGQVHRREINVRDGLANAVRDAQQELDTAWAQVGGR